MTSLPERLDRHIAALQRRIDVLHETNHAEVLNANPAADVGGIRGRSQKRRDQSIDRTLRRANAAMELRRQRDRLAAMKRNYLKAQELAMLYREALEHGTVNGQPLRAPLTSQRRKDYEAEWKRQKRAVTDIERAVAALAPLPDESEGR